MPTLEERVRRLEQMFENVKEGKPFWIEPVGKERPEPAETEKEKPK